MLSADEAAKVRYMNYSYWVELSGGSRRPAGTLHLSSYPGFSDIVTAARKRHEPGPPPGGRLASQAIRMARDNGTRSLDTVVNRRGPG